MMRALVATVAVVLALATVLPASADDGDNARLSTVSAQIGQQSTLVLDVVTPKGATVEVDPAAPSWNGVEVIRLVSSTSTDSGGQTTHRLELLVAPFSLGALSFAPAVNVIQGADVTPRSLPAVKLTVLSTLGANAPATLSPLAPPRSIAGAESPLLMPAIISGVVLAGLLAAALVALAAVALRRRLRRAAPAVEEVRGPPGLDGAERLLDVDPVGAYRSLAATVRAVLADRYGIPARALTTLELQRRMESHGIDRWQARLVGGFLDECDAVVYAGYRPAAERRMHDLTMAREILGEGA
ncbi:MAG: hypothetical protein HYX53_11260 [Chloroflexi bacterium]|nr:hypothetical protein [Chloroflexota bacterium]